MEGDTVSIPMDGGPGHVIQGLLSSDKKPGGVPLAACPPPCSPQQRPSKCMGQGRTTSHVSPPFPGVPVKQLSRVSGCIQPKERGGSHLFGSPREQTPPARPHTLLVGIASKAVIISSVLPGSSAD